MVAGGTCCYSPEPLAPFVDFFVLGEGEEVTLEYIELYKKARNEEWSKEELLREVAKIPGIYVPSLYEVTYQEDGKIAAITPKDGAPASVTKVMTLLLVMEALESGKISWDDTVTASEAAAGKGGCRFLLVLILLSHDKQHFYGGFGAQIHLKLCGIQSFLSGKQFCHALHLGEIELRNLLQGCLPCTQGPSGALSASGSHRTGYKYPSLWFVSKPY